MTSLGVSDLAGGWYPFEEKLKERVNLVFVEFEILREGGHERGQNLIDDPVKRDILEFVAWDIEQLAQGPNLFCRPCIQRKPLISETDDSQVGHHAS